MNYIANYDDKCDHYLQMKVFKQVSVDKLSVVFSYKCSYLKKCGQAISA